MAEIYILENTINNKCYIGQAIEKRMNKIRGRKMKIITCPHCGNTTMPRWHFNNCKEDN